MDFEQFTKSGLPNGWVVEYRILHFYVRRTDPRIKYKLGDFQLVSMRNSVPGSGLLTTFLNKWERTYQFYIENIFEKRLYDYFKERKYSVIDGNRPYCVLGPMPTELT
jgi:hypothetical protein